MFRPKHGPKEGRSPPGLLYAGGASSRGRVSQRQVVVVLAVCVCTLMGYFVLNSGDNASLQAASYQAALRDNDLQIPKVQPGAGKIVEEVLSDSSQAVGNVPEAHAGTTTYNEKSSFANKDDSDTPQRGSGGQPDKSTTNSGGIVTDPEADSISPSNPKGWSPSGSKSQELTTGKAIKWADRPGFERALKNVLDMLPDEVHMRELTRTIDATGKERLREMGLRTRAYKKYFDAWEALHLVSGDDGAMYVRDDVIQYLRGHQNSGLGDKTDGMGGNLAETIRRYEAYRSFLHKFGNLLFPWTAPYFSDHMTLHTHIKKGGRGIVLTAGDDQAPYLLTTIHTFRELGCTLPIEVMYLGDQDLGEDYRLELEDLPGVVTRDIAQMTNDEGWKLAGWAAKPFAILLSSFREVIFIDADSLFFKDPAVLFEDPNYVEKGALFFKDRLIMPENRKRWLQQVLPQPIPKLAKQSRFWSGVSGHMQESGVIVVDKWKHFIPLLLVTRMNGPDRDGNKDQGKIGVYDMVYGDKETFWIGWLLAGDEGYHFHEGFAGIMGKSAERGGSKDGHDDEHEHEHDHKKRGDEDQEALSEDESASEEKKEKKPITKAVESNLATDNEPSNYTICAPQLLHLDMQGRPLWFNGWLLDNKFVEKSKKKFASFDEFLMEPEVQTEPAAWKLAQSNKCCLTVPADRHFLFTQEEKATLAMMMERATVMGMGDQR